MAPNAAPARLACPGRAPPPICRGPRLSGRHRGLPHNRPNGAPPATRAIGGPNTDPARSDASEGLRDRASAYGETPDVLKSVVSGLTGIINWAGDLVAPNPPQPLAKDAFADARPPLTPQQLYAGVREDFEERGYPWSGEISEGLYDEDCRFTDPTLSFRGLEKFRRNLSNLKPIVERFVGPREVELFSCELDDAAGVVRASWRMYGELDLPWKPVVDVSGTTVFTYDSEKGNRIVSYDETWEVPPGQAFLQLLTPGQRK